LSVSACRLAFTIHVHTNKTDTGGKLKKERIRGCGEYRQTGYVGWRLHHAHTQTKLIREGKKCKKRRGFEGAGKRVGWTLLDRTCRPSFCSRSSCLRTRGGGDGCESRVPHIGQRGPALDRVYPHLRLLLRFVQADWQWCLLFFICRFPQRMRATARQAHVSKMMYTASSI